MHRSSSSFLNLKERMKTQLKDRTLWFDGTNQVDPDLVPDLLLRGVSQDKIIAEENDDLKLFNQIADDPILSTKTENALFDLSWNIPDQYVQLDLPNYLKSKLAALQNKNDRYKKPEYEARLQIELVEIEKREITSLVKTLIYIVDQLRANGKVWGVGRGSSCASLILFLMDLHKVDPIRFGISHTEFFHD